jgi:hypothetical protein
MATNALGVDPGHLTDAQARNLVIKSLRQARAAYRAADTAGEKEEREYDRLIKRKTRINASSFRTLDQRYRDYLKKAEAIAAYLATAMEIASKF